MSSKKGDKSSSKSSSKGSGATGSKASTSENYPDLTPYDPNEKLATERKPNPKLVTVRVRGLIEDLKSDTAAELGLQGLIDEIPQMDDPQIFAAIDEGLLTSLLPLLEKQELFDQILTLINLILDSKPQFIADFLDIGLVQPLVDRARTLKHDSPEALVMTLYHLTMGTPKEKRALVATKMIPVLLDLMGHSDPNIVNESVIALHNIIMGAIDATPTHLPHPYFYRMKKSGSIDRIWELYRTVDDEEIKGTLAVLICGLYRRLPMEDQSIFDIIFKMVKNEEEDEQKDGFRATIFLTSHLDNHPFLVTHDVIGYLKSLFANTADFWQSSALALSTCLFKFGDAAMKAQIKTIIPKAKATKLKKSKVSDVSINADALLLQAHRSLALSFNHLPGAMTTTNYSSSGFHPDEWSRCSTYVKLDFHLGPEANTAFLWTSCIRIFGHTLSNPSEGLELQFMSHALDLEFKITSSQNLVLRYHSSQDPGRIAYVFATTFQLKDTFESVYVLAHSGGLYPPAFFVTSNCQYVFNAFNLPCPPDFPPYAQFNIVSVTPSILRTLASNTKIRDIAETFLKTNLNSDRMRSPLVKRLFELKDSYSELLSSVERAIDVALRRAQRNPTEVTVSIIVNEPDNPPRTGPALCKTKVSYLIPVCLFSMDPYTPDLAFAFQVSPPIGNRLLLVERAFIGVFISARSDSYWLCNVFQQRYLSDQGQPRGSHGYPRRAENRHGHRGYPAQNTSTQMGQMMGDPYMFINTRYTHGPM
ncbi:hypothetical protein BLNAU_11576 [Blattamonas nauphoetae]|uniref:Uncharacterized protein n=1 Tax=Blattamonas nauphoetae TaxID=2049346 RepID=A0ABQ9XRM8_9EUKA|nr:hypothetical protein BLNAU_11576 [Blattamonas nauphoetae]